MFEAFSVLPPSWYYIYLYFCVLTLRAGVLPAVLSYRERVTNGHMLTSGVSDPFVWITPYGGDLTFLINAAVVGIYKDHSIQSRMQALRGPVVCFQTAKTNK